MNKRIKVLVSAVLATVMLVLCIPFTAAAAGTTVSVTLADKGWTNSTQYTTLEMDSVVTVTVAGGSNTGKYYDSGTAWRLYASENATMTIAAEGKTIDGVKITYTSYKTGILSLNGNEVESDEVVTVNASTITFDVLDTDTSDGNGQARIVKIEVYYGYNGSIPSCTHAYTNDYDATCNNCGESRIVTLPAADSTLTIVEANKLGVAQDHSAYTSGKYYVEGVVDEIYDTQYGNMIIKDANGNEFTVYGSYDSTGEIAFKDMTDPFAVGDTVKVYGNVGQYSGTAQIKNGWVTKVTAQGGNQGGTTGGNTTTTPTTGGVKVGTGYTISATNAAGKIYVTGSVKGGRFEASLDAKDAAVFYVESAGKTGEYYLYFKKDGVKTYVAMDDKSTGASVTTDKKEASVFEWDTEVKTLVVADDNNDRAFGVDPSKDYKDFNTYASNQSKYVWGEFTPVGGGNNANTGDSAIAYVVVAIVSLFGIAYVSKKH